jgi:hypothetical protein
LENDAYIISMDYSPLLAGFAIVLNDGRAGFLTSSNLKYDPNVISSNFFSKIYQQHKTICLKISASKWNLGS